MTKPFVWGAPIEDEEDMDDDSGESLNNSPEP